MAHDVFISHSTQDKVVADAVCAALEAEKIRCWIAPRDIKSGESWAEAITKALKSSRLMVLIFSDHSNQSKQVANELTLAVNAKAVVVPLKIEDIPPTHIMEYYLTGAHWLDAMNPPTEEQIKQLVETVKRNLVSGAGEAVIPATDRRATISDTPAANGLAATRPVSAIKKFGMIAAALLLGGLLIYGGSSLFTGFSSSEDATESETGSGVFIPPEIGTIIVTTTDDEGEGSLRWALHQARPEDVITFDPSVFPSNKPATIFVMSPLPPLNKGRVIINASNAGVIIDGAKGKSPSFFAGIDIKSSDNIIMGLQIVNCWGYDDRFDDYYAGAGILIADARTQNNIIGGDRSIGSGPSGQGNIIAGNAIGINLGQGAEYNIITGNIIGADASGEQESSYYGNDRGISVTWKTKNNMIGPDNIIAFNRLAIEIGLSEDDQDAVTNLETVNNTITANKIFSNDYPILISGVANKSVSPPRIISVNLATGIVRGTACPGCTIEIFSDQDNQGEIFEGRVQADENGSFTFEAGKSLTGPNITATATDEDGNTSEFSVPASQ
jgi:hypothetical protein